MDAHQTRRRQEVLDAMQKVTKKLADIDAAKAAANRANARGDSVKPWNTTMKAVRLRELKREVINAIEYYQHVFRTDEFNTELENYRAELKGKPKGRTKVGV